MKTKTYLNILSAFLLSFSLGCVVFRAGQLPSGSFGPPESKASKSISVIVSGKAIVNGKDVDVPPSFLAVWQEQTAKAYKDSGLFSDVKEGVAETDLRAEVQITDQAKASSVLAFFTALTLFIIPSYGTDELFVKTTIKDRNATKVGTFEKSETLRVWTQFFLIIAMPFNSPRSVVRGTIYDLNRVIINEAHAKGALKS